MRYFFEIAYNGTHFHGWQRQDNAISVQEAVEKALSTVLRYKVSILGSGRTDTGVHCEQQFFHADLTNKIDAENLKYKLNSFLIPSVAIGKIVPVNENAHTRFDAISRTYQYRITKVKSPFLNDLTYYYPRALNIEHMNTSASYLIGTQDFECFSKVKTEVNNFNCTITQAKWFINEQGLLIFEVTANRFLRGMVRAIVGTMLQVGSGKMKSEDIVKIIESKSRKNAGSAAPAKGLFLTKVDYPENIYL